MKCFYEELNKCEEGEHQSDDEENIDIEDDGVYEVERLIQKRIVKVIITWKMIYYTCMHNISTYRVKAGVFSQEEFSATSLFKLVFTLVSLSIIKIPSLGNIELVKLFYTV